MANTLVPRRFSVLTLTAKFLIATVMFAAVGLVEAFRAMLVTFAQLLSVYTSYVNSVLAPLTAMYRLPSVQELVEDEVTLAETTPPKPIVN